MDDKPLPVIIKDINKGLVLLWLDILVCKSRHLKVILR